MVAGAFLRRLEGHIPQSGEAIHGHGHILRLHHITALADTRHGFCGSHGGRPVLEGGRRHRVRAAEAPTSVRGDGKLHTVLDGDLARVSHFMAAGPIPGLFAAGHQNGTDAQGGNAQQMHLVAVILLRAVFVHARGECYRWLTTTVTLDQLLISTAFIRWTAESVRDSKACAVNQGRRKESPTLFGGIHCLQLDIH